MESEDQLINRVSKSSLVVFDLEQYYKSGERVSIDIKDQLFQGLILREKDFREYIKNHNWIQYKNKFVAIHCSTDAIVPTWAYMLLSIALEPYASRMIFGSLQELETQLYYDAFSTIDWTSYMNSKVVIKGCSKVDVPVAVYVEATSRLKSLASSLMFGEPCSTVPLYKRAKE